jgi:urease alpha subunit
MFGAYGKARTESSVTFVSQAAIEDGLAHKLGTAKHWCAVENTRGGISKASMVLNDALPHIEVDPETYEVRADGELADLRTGDSRADGAAVFPVLEVAKDLTGHPVPEIEKLLFG